MRRIPEYVGQYKPWLTVADSSDQQNLINLGKLAIKEHINIHNLIDTDILQKKKFIEKKVKVGRQALLTAKTCNKNDSNSVALNQ